MLFEVPIGGLASCLCDSTGGIDESDVHKPYKPKSHGLGNSQVLPRDYYRRADIELVLREMAEQVAIRLRRAHKKCCTVSIYIGLDRKSVV